MPADWPIMRIDDLFAIQQGKQVSAKLRDGHRQRPFLRTKNVYWGRLDLTELDAMHFSEEDERRLRLLPGDLLTCEGGWVGRTSIWNGEASDCLFQNHLHRLRRISTDTDPRFTLYWLWYAFDIGEIYFGRQNVTTIPNLSKSRLGELPMPSPSGDEQRRIAVVLSAVQRAIQRQERLIALNVELERALMRKLFTEGTRGERLRHTEIGMVPESWELAPVSSLVERTLQNGAFIKKPTIGRGLPFVNVVNMYGDICVAVDELERLDVRADEVQRYLLQDGDVLLVRSSLKREGIGQSSVVRAPAEPMFFDCHLIRVRPNRLRMNPKFLSFFWRSDVGKADLIRRSKTTTMTTINQKNASAALVPVPSMEEQSSIVSILLKVEKKARIHHRQRRALQTIFRTLLHQLMTARVRIHDFDLSVLEGGEQEPVGAV
jgi:type I restriction enzyme S subunit